jgi:hypothetical protein
MYYREIMIDVQRPEFMTGFMSKRQIHNLYAPWSKSYPFAEATRLRLCIRALDHPHSWTSIFILYTS